MVPTVVSRRELLKTGAMGAAGAAVLAACGPGTSSSPSSAAVSPATSPTSGGGGYVAPSPDLTATLKIYNWGDPQDIDFYKDVAERFRTRYPNVTVNDDFIPIVSWVEYINGLVSDISAGNAPDVVNIAVQGFRLGISKDLYLPLDNYLSSDPAGAELLGDVDQPLVDAVKFQNATYLIPWGWNAMLMQYNTKMFADAGVDRPSDDWTWDDFLEIAQQLTTGEGGNKVHGFVISNHDFMIAPWLYTNGTSLLNADWTASNLNDPKVLETVVFLRDLIHEQQVAPSVEGVDPFQLFPAGKAAMVGGGHWTAGPYKTAGFEDWDVLPWPQKAAKSTQFGLAGHAIYSKSQNADIAWEYLKELTSKESSDQFARRGAANPARRSSAQLPEWLAFPEHAELFYESLEYGKLVESPANYLDLETIYLRATGEILAGAGDPAAILQAAHEELQATF